MNQLAPYIGHKYFSSLVILALIMIATSVIATPVELYANPPGIDFYSPSSPPPGQRSLDDLIASYWNWVNSQSYNGIRHWPQCLKGDGGTIGNQSVVFLGNPAFADEKNVNATKQKCEISSDQLLYLTVYPGEAATGSKPGTGEYPNQSTDELLALAQDSNKVMKLMIVKVDGQDVSPSIVKQHSSKPFKFIVPTEDNPFEWKAGVVGENMTSLAENFYLFFKTLPVGKHNLELNVIRDPLGGGKVENLHAKWEIEVKPA